MGGQEQQTHPASDALAAFALGHLDDNTAHAIADHLGSCASCRKAVQAVPDDSMLSLLRPASSTPVPRPEKIAATTGAFESGVPAELLDHARYRILRLLGAGGMGVVYQAEHRLMKRSVALKVISKQLTASPGVVERFRREIRAVARLAHPNLVQAYDAEQEGDLHFLVMEFVEGENLSWLVEREGPLPIHKACDCVRQAAQGLAHALRLGLVHRDIKPHNLMLTPQGQVKVLDFGLASIERCAADGLTELGQGMGTPGYVAPEQVRNAHSADARSDVYSLGCTFYFLLTGQPPFPEGTSAQKVAAHLEKQPTPPQQLRPELPTELVRVIERMMAKEPARRYQTPEDVIAAVEPWCQASAETNVRPRPWHAARGLFQRPRTAAVAGGAVLVLFAAALGYLVLGGREPANHQQAEERPSSSVERVVEKGDAAPDLNNVAPSIDDDFSNPGDSRFSDFRDDKVGCEARIEAGLWIMRLFPRPQHRIAHRVSRGPAEHVFGDFACRIVGQVLTGGDHGWALGLWSPAKESDLAVRIRRDGLVEVGNFFWDREAESTTVGPIRPPAFRPGDQLNTVLVVLREGRMLEVYVNGAALGRPIQLERPLGPRVGLSTVLWQRSRATGVEGLAKFHRFTLWRLAR
jgi:hypothetical protein